MSLPRSDYDPRRVCVNPFPFLNNINLGKQRRTLGVYVAGGLVSSAPHPRSVPSLLTDPSFVRTTLFPLVRSWTLDILRCRYSLCARTPTI